MGRFSLLRKKEVINLEDGRRLGVICDADLDLEDGSVKAIMVRVPVSYGGVRRRKHRREVIIPYNRIVRAGGDVILVRAENANIQKFLEAGM